MIHLSGMARVAAALAVATLGVLPLSAAAQEPSEAEVQAARAAISALGATDQFDAILPNAADALKGSLIQAAPNLEKEISATVDAKALEMAGRRADLEREAALIYARNFSLEELQAISDFYQSEAGQALIERGPRATREILQAAEIWSNGIARDLAAETNQALRASLGQEPGTDNLPAAPEQSQSQ